MTDGWKDGCLGVRLSAESVEAVARRTAELLFERLRLENNPQGDLLTTEEAARILRISPVRLRRIKDRFPHVKAGDERQGKLLFVKEGLVRGYAEGRSEGEDEGRRGTATNGTPEGRKTKTKMKTKAEAKPRPTEKTGTGTGTRTGTGTGTAVKKQK